MRSSCPFALAAFVLSAAFLEACVHHDDGPVTTETRRPQTTAQAPVTGSFSRIDLRGPIDVVVREAAAGSEPTIAVTGDKFAQAHVLTRVDGDTLIVDLDENDRHEGMCFGICVSESEDAKVTVSIPAFRGATIEGSGDLSVEASGAHPEVDFDVRGSGDVKYSGEADVVRCAIDGSGDVSLRGSGRRLEAVVHGSGDVKASEFPVEGGVYEIDGSGDISTSAHGGEVSVHINGSGDLLYRGDAKITSLDVSGSGSVRQLGGNED